MATSGGRLVEAAAWESSIGFGLVAPTSGKVPRMTAAQAYAQLAAQPEPGPPVLGVGPVVTLAMATMAFSKPSHDALVWLFLWPGQQCIAVGAPIDNSLFPQSSPVPTSEPCTAYVLMSDTTRKLVTSGSA